MLRRKGSDLFIFFISYKVFYVVPKAGLIVWFYDCILGKSDQDANPIIAKIDPISHYSICERFIVANILITNGGKTLHNLLLIPGTM